MPNNMRNKMPIKIALVQFRLNQDMALHEQKCILRDLQIPMNQLTAFDAINHDFNSFELVDFDGFIFGGSGDISVSSDNDIIIRVKNHTNNLIKKIIISDTPSLFICLGYHLLSDYLAEPVKKIYNQSESGTTKVELTPAGLSDPIFQGLTKQIIVQQAHNDSIEFLPKNASLLAENQKCPIQAFKIKNNVYAMQFHPELQKEDMLIRLKNYSNKYPSDKSIFQESKETVKIMQNFKQIIEKNK
jgi:GMP synthase (glutamine-hydrolysing)